MPPDQAPPMQGDCLDALPFSPPPTHLAAFSVGPPGQSRPTASSLWLAYKGQPSFHANVARKTLSLAVGERGFGLGKFVTQEKRSPHLTPDLDPAQVPGGFLTSVKGDMPAAQ